MDRLAGLSLSPQAFDMLLLRVLPQPAVESPYPHIARNDRFILVHPLKHESFEQVAKDEGEFFFWIHLCCLAQPFITNRCLSQLIEEELICLIEICLKSLIEIINELGECYRLLSHYTNTDFLGAIEGLGIAIGKTG